EVPVSFDETGNQQPAAKVDDLRRRPRHRANLGGGANRRDEVAAHGHRLCFRLAVVSRDNVAIDEDEIRGRLLGAAGELAGQHAGRSRQKSLHLLLRLVLRQAPGSGISRMRRALPPRMAARSSAESTSASMIACCASKIAFCHPRGKNDESVPNRMRSPPATSIVCLKTSVSVCRA